MASESIIIDGKTYVLLSQFQTLIPERMASLRFAANLDGNDVALGSYKGKIGNDLFPDVEGLKEPDIIYDETGNQLENIDDSKIYNIFMTNRNGTSPSKIYYIDTDFEPPYYSTTSTNTFSEIVGGRKRRRTKSTKKSKRRTKSAKKSKRRRSN